MGGHCRGAAPHVSRRHRAPGPPGGKGAEGDRAIPAGLCNNQAFADLTRPGPPIREEWRLRMLRSHDTDPSPHVTINRRRAPRFDVRERLVGYLLKEQQPVRVRDISSGGFSLETVERLGVERLYHVRFTAIDDWSAILPAQALHCRPSCAPDGSPRYVTGFSFAASPVTQSDRIIRRLIEKVTFEASDTN
jgi:hypothetical protein